MISLSLPLWQYFSVLMITASLALMLASIVLNIVSSLLLNVVGLENSPRKTAWCRAADVLCLGRFAAKFLVLCRVAWWAINWPVFRHDKATTRPNMRLLGVGVTRSDVVRPCGVIGLIFGDIPTILERLEAMIRRAPLCRQNGDWIFDHVGASKGVSHMSAPTGVIYGNGSV